MRRLLKAPIRQCTSDLVEERQRWTGCTRALGAKARGAQRLHRSQSRCRSRQPLSASNAASGTGSTLCKRPRGELGQQARRGHTAKGIWVSGARICRRSQHRSRQTRRDDAPNAASDAGSPPLLHNRPRGRAPAARRGDTMKGIWVSDARGVGAGASTGVGRRDGRCTQRRVGPGSPPLLHNRPRGRRQQARRGDTMKGIWMPQSSEAGRGRGRGRGTPPTVPPVAASPPAAAPICRTRSWSWSRSRQGDAPTAPPVAASPPPPPRQHLPDAVVVVVAVAAGGRRPPRRHSRHIPRRRASRAAPGGTAPSVASTINRDNDGGRQGARLEVGDRVQIFDPQLTPQYNGHLGRIVKIIQAKKSRWWYWTSHCVYKDSNQRSISSSCRGRGRRGGSGGSGGGSGGEAEEATTSGARLNR